MNTYNTCKPPILGGFPCSQAHKLLTCDQPDHKDKFSPIKKKYEKIRYFDQNFRDGPLNGHQLLSSESSEKKYSPLSDFKLVLIKKLVS